MSATRLSLAGVPMEIRLGSPAGESLASQLLGLADLIDAGLFGDAPAYANDTVTAYLQRCAQVFAEPYEDVPVNVAMRRENRSPTPFVITVMFDYVEVIECHDFIAALTRADRQVAVALVEALSEAGSWWFPVFGPHAGYEIAEQFRFGIPDEWWDEMRSDTKDALELEREPTNAEVRKYIRTMKVPTRGMYAKRLGVFFCRSRRRKRLSLDACAERIARLRSKALRGKAQMLHESIASLHKLRRKMNRLYTRDDRDVRMEEDYYDALPAFILETAPQFNEQGYVTELFTEMEQSVMSGNGWGPNYHFALEATPQSVARLRQVLDVYGNAFGILFALKDTIGDTSE